MGFLYVGGGALAPVLAYSLLSLSHGILPSEVDNLEFFIPLPYGGAIVIGEGKASFVGFQQVTEEGVVEGVMVDGEVPFGVYSFEDLTIAI